jgi:hypothetical protein
MLADDKQMVLHSGRLLPNTQILDQPRKIFPETNALAYFSPAVSADEFFFLIDNSIPMRRVPGLELRHGFFFCVTASIVYSSNVIKTILSVIYVIR